MSIIAKSISGWLLDHEADINNHYQHLPEKMECLPALFDIVGPFINDSEFNKKQAAPPMGSPSLPDELPHSGRRKRKRKLPSDPVEIKQDEYHREVVKRIQPMIDDLVQLGERYFTAPPSDHDNNKAAREAARLEGMLTEMPVERTDDDEETMKPLVIEQNAEITDDLTNRIVEYPDTVPTRVTWSGHAFLVPARSRFVISDFSKLEEILGDEQFDCLVIDPPWENKSVKRKKSYATLTDWDLYRLPVKRLAPPGALVVCWVTNRLRQIKFAKGALFKHWGLQFLAEWHWVKVAKSGQLVRALDSLQKKPYETLLVGRRVETDLTSLPEGGHALIGKETTGRRDSSVPSYQTGNDVNEREKKCGNAEIETTVAAQQALAPGEPQQALVPGDRFEEAISDESAVVAIPDRCVLVSVPCSTHSRKPTLQVNYLAEILKNYLPEKARCLELFSRSLTPGWTSWGDQVLRHQHVDFFRRSRAVGTMTTTGGESSSS